MTPFRSDALNKLVTRKLDHDETIMWLAERCHATPQQLTMYWLQLIPALLFALVFVNTTHGLADIDHSAGWATVAPIYLFFLLLLSLILAFPVFCLLRANRFAYAVTNKRLLVLNDFLIPMARSVLPEEMEFAGLVETGERGTISIRNTRLIHFEVTTLKQMERLLMPRKIMNALNARGAMKPLNALIQLNTDRQAEEAKKPKLNQGLFKPTRW